MASHTPPIHKCPECGGHGTLQSQGWHDNTNHVKCSPARVDNVTPESGGCGYGFDVEHSDSSSDLEAELEALRAELSSLKDSPTDEA